MCGMFQRSRHQRPACRRRFHHTELDERRHVRHAGDDRRKGVGPHPREGHGQGDQTLLPASHRVQASQDHGRRRVDRGALAARACQTLNPTSSAPHPVLRVRWSTSRSQFQQLHQSVIVSFVPHTASLLRHTTGAFSLNSVRDYLRSTVYSALCVCFRYYPRRRLSWGGPRLYRRFSL